MTRLAQPCPARVIKATTCAAMPSPRPVKPSFSVVLPFMLIAADLDMDAAAINIKGKTTDKLGFTGRGEGIAAHAAALITRRAEG